MKTFVLALSLALLTSANAAWAQDDPPPTADPTSTPAPTPTPTPTPTPPPDEVHPAGPPRYDLIRLNAGVRIGYIKTSGFDAFSTNDVLSQFSIDGTVPLVTAGKLVLGAGLGWDVGERSATNRGFDSSLTVHRLYVPIEARYNVVPGVYAFGKVAPGAAAMITSLQDPSSPASLRKTGWAFSGDASVGASILMGPRAKLEKKWIPRFWLTPEVGYSFTTNADVSPSPDRASDDALGTDESVSRRTLALSGFFWRASVGVTF